MVDPTLLWNVTVHEVVFKHKQAILNHVICMPRVHRRFRQVPHSRTNLASRELLLQLLDERVFVLLLGGLLLNQLFTRLC